MGHFNAGLRINFFKVYAEICRFAGEGKRAVAFVESYRMVLGFLLFLDCFFRFICASSSGDNVFFLKDEMLYCSVSFVHFPAWWKPSPTKVHFLQWRELLSSEISSNNISWPWRADMRERHYFSFHSFLLALYVDEAIGSWLHFNFVSGAP